jgi:hypothetical protein
MHGKLIVAPMKHNNSRRFYHKMTVVAGPIHSSAENEATPLMCIANQMTSEVVSCVKSDYVFLSDWDAPATSCELFSDHNEATKQFFSPDN